jgi:2-polyprenyl-3-methyl-5-hydroxy-6-metoxy-1,4-benzoquinol methylase
MTRLNPQPVSAEIEAAVGQTIADLGAAFSGVLVNIGRRLGLYKAMAEIGTCTSEQLAQATDVRERYVREWLNNQAAGGYVHYEPDGRRYTLPAPQAMVLAVEDSPVYMAPAFDVAAAFWLDEERILETFRSGEGFGWHEHNERLFCGTEMFFRTGYRTHLVSAWLPALDGIVERLRAGARVADVGCGHGASTIIMASAFPKSEFVGIDYHADSIATAGRRAREGGVDNLRFEVATAKDYAGRDFDLVCFMDCLHDLGDPLGALVHARDAVRPDGKVMLVEPYAGDAVEENLNPVGRLFYAASAMACTPNSLSQEVGLGLGAQAGAERLRRLALQAGFRDLRLATRTPVNLVLEVVR